MFIDNSIIDINPLSDFNFDFIFSNINALFKKQEVSFIIKCNSGFAINLYINASASYTNSLALKKQFAKINTLSSCSF